MEQNGNELGNGLPPIMFGGGGQGIPMHQALQGIPGLQQGISMQGLQHHHLHPGFAMQQQYQQQPMASLTAVQQQLGIMGGDNPHAELLATKPSPAPKFKKAPDAPKRFKSAFIIFSAEKHKLIKEDFAKEGRTEKTTDIAKRVSEAWRNMPAEEKESWEKMARKDKARYEVEKALYKGPWKVPANKRTPKDPTAPKRPMSAFLAFSNKRRAALKRENPDATNADLSKMLSKTWKEAADDLRKQYMDEEAELRAMYKVSMASWRKKVAEEKRQEREEREAVAMKHAEAQQNEAQQPQQLAQQQQQPPQADISQPAVDQSQLFYPYMAQMGNLFASTGGMPNGGGDPSQQYANMLAANNFAQQQFSLPQQQQLLSQLFNAQHFKYPNMNGATGMYPGMQGQFAFQGQQMAPQGMSPQNQGMSAMQQQQVTQNFAMQQQQLQQQLAMAQAMQQQQQQQPMMDHQQQQQQQQQQEAMMIANAQQQQYGMQFQGDDDDDRNEGGDDEDDDDDDQESVKDDDTPPYGVSL